MDEVELNAEDMQAAEKCGYKPEEALAFKGIYTHYDQNFGKGDGKCSVALVKSMVRALGIQMKKSDEDDLGKMLDDADENKDGKLYYSTV